MFGLTPICPAYGRDYSSKAKAQADFSKGLDFQAASGQYCSREDFTAGQAVECRSADKRKIFMLKA